MDILSLHNSGQTAPATAPPVEPGRAAQNREVVQAVKALNGAGMFGQDNELTFLLDRQTQRLVVRLVNRKTKEVVRQLPPENVLRAAQQLRA